VLRFQNHSPFTIHHSPFTIQIQAYPIFTDALRLAKQYQATRLLSYAKGLLGQLYESQQRYPDALLLTREAKFFAQAFPDLLYLWEWQQARLLLALKDLDGALAAYQRTIVYLQPIRTQLSVGQRDRQEVFYERIRPVYYGFADVLLQQAQATSSPPQKAKWLNQARDIIEQLKAAELENYLQKDCMSVQTPIALLDNLIRQKNTAVFYPVLLSDRAELLLSLPDGIHQIVIPVRYDVLKETVLEFRRNLQRTAKGSFINQAKQLYQWLIAPLMAKLVAHNINTLVIVPDSFLRIIPMAALYDAQEKQFLYQRFALATTPGLTLTDPQPLERHQVKVLLNGLSEGVQGFPPLPSVIQEINTIKKVFTQSTVLIDKDFSLNGINESLQTTPYQIVHISSHGQFDRNPKESFLLTYDDKLTMDRLEKLFQLSEFRSEKVELLTLSACQTAVGDERAALGLAGVAIKAGARSALASLWFVDDEATSQLIAEFYQQLQNPALSKAQALQNAQKKLAKKRKFRHPAYWAPFLLIGNWL
jgi:CHAT domain-containing protein